MLLVHVILSRSRCRIASGESRNQPTGHSRLTTWRLCFAETEWILVWHALTIAFAFAFTFAHASVMRFGQHVRVLARSRFVLVCIRLGHPRSVATLVPQALTTFPRHTTPRPLPCTGWLQSSMLSLPLAMDIHACACPCCSCLTLWSAPCPTRFPETRPIPFRRLDMQHRINHEYSRRTHLRHSHKPHTYICQSGEKSNGKDIAGKSRICVHQVGWRMWESYEHRSTNRPKKSLGTQTILEFLLNFFFWSVHSVVPQTSQTRREMDDMHQRPIETKASGCLFFNDHRKPSAWSA